MLANLVVDKNQRPANDKIHDKRDKERVPLTRLTHRVGNTLVTGRLVMKGLELVLGHVDQWNVNQNGRHPNEDDQLEGARMRDDRLGNQRLTDDIISFKTNAENGQD